MAHPYAELLKDRHVRVLWAGIALSALGGEFFRVGAIWLAAGLAGADASLLVTAQAAAIVAVSLLAGPVVEALPRRILLIGSDLLSVAASVAVVGVALSSGLTFAVLLLAGVLLAALGAIARPIFLSSIPALAPDRIREVNGLFDSTVRLAQAAGPVLAAAALKVMPAIHLLTANAASFLASAAAIALVGRRLDRAPGPAAVGSREVLRRLNRGVAAANGCPGVWSVLVATSVRGGAYALGYTVAVPVLFAQQPGGGGLAAVALIFGAGAAAELISTPLLVLTHPARPLRRLFQGYVLIGASLAAMGLAAAALPPAWRLPAMAATAILMGVGNSISTLQITTFFATRLPGDDYAAVLRLRMVTIIGSMMLTTAAGPWILPTLGIAPTIIACGVVATVAGLIAVFGGPAGRLGPSFDEPGLARQA
jgi:MFS transporter, DHA3 family, macrolide efflux protein